MNRVNWEIVVGDKVELENLEIKRSIGPRDFYVDHDASEGAGHNRQMKVCLNKSTGVKGTR